MLPVLVLACTNPTQNLESPAISSLPAVNETIRENKFAGTPNWETPVKPDSPDSLAVFAAPYDAARGDTVRVFINSGFSRVTLHVYRIGWYDGLGAREMLQDSVQIAAKQPACTPAFPGPVTCPWTESYRFVVDARWRSGIYLIKLTTTNAVVAAYPFVVRGTGPTPELTVVVPQFSWQAYNTFGGSSLYVTDPSTGYSVPKVSFSRPYAGGLQRIALGGTDARAAVAFLERSGFNINYISDRELADSTVDYTRPSHGYVFLGHDEYWTWNEFNRVQAARDAGLHLAFLGANNAYWNIRLSAEPGTGRADGLITCYKAADRDLDAHGRTEVTTTFHSSPLNRPENTLYGIMYMGSRHTSPKPDYVVNPGTLRGVAKELLTQAGLNPGDSLHLALGVEGDGVNPYGGTPDSLQVLLQTTYVGSGEPTYSNVVSFFQTRSGAGVFAFGNNAWPGFLDGPDLNLRAEALTAAVLKWMSAH